MKARPILYTLARLLGDVSALKSGSPVKVAKRIRNKGVGRVINKKIYR